MNLYAQPLFGLKGVNMEPQPDTNGERKAVIHLTAQAGLEVALHMNASEWRWLALILAEKLAEEKARLGEE